MKQQEAVSNFVKEKNVGQPYLLAISEAKPVPGG